MVDGWLVFAGLTELAKEVLGKLGEEVLKDYVKDLFKDSLKGAVASLEPKAKLKVIAEALNEFVRIVETALYNSEDEDLTEAIVRDSYSAYLVPFLREARIREILVKPFDRQCRSFDDRQVATLATCWDELPAKLKPTKFNPFRSMPQGFNWADVARDYVKAVKTLVKKNAELRAILEAENLEAIADSLQATQPIVAGFDLGQYRRVLRQRYGNLELETLDLYAEHAGMELWRIFIPQNAREVHRALPKFFELPRDLLQQWLESGEMDAEMATCDPRALAEFREQETRPILEVLADEKCPIAVVLGDPGAGKSTLLRYLAVRWAIADPTENTPLPLLVELRSYAESRRQNLCTGILDFFDRGTNLLWRCDRHVLHERLQEDNVLVMFDGLDEEFDQGRRENLVSEIVRFASEYSKARIVVTSRIIGYKFQRFRDAGFRHFLLQDLDEPQIEEFSQKWHEIAFADESKRAERRDRLRTSISNSRSLRNLAGNPLLLTMMAIINRNQELPRDRTDLYDQAARVLLYQWDVQRALEDAEMQTIDYADKRAMLRLVAHKMQASDKGLAGNIMHGEEIEEIFFGYLAAKGFSDPKGKAWKIRDRLRCRNFILCDQGGDYYGFVHRTFLEYFCATEFADRLSRRGLSGGMDETELVRDVFGQHWQEEAWHEVLRLIAGSIAPEFAAQAIEYLLTCNPAIPEHRNEIGHLQKQGVTHLLLAASLLAEVRDRNTIADTATKLLDTMKSLAEATLGVEAAIAVASAMKQTWGDDPAVMRWLNTCSDEPIPDTLDDLSSDKGVDYSKLRDLLAACEWQKADYETYLVMLQVVGRKEGDWIRSEEFEKFPCKDLHTIDRLWVKYSQGKFGFSQQKTIWLSVGGNPKADFAIYQTFSTQVGWYSINNFMNSTQIYAMTAHLGLTSHLPWNPNLRHDSTPWTHIPSPVGYLPWRGWWGLRDF
ncbi:hypothetical protein TUMEXPCC7403_12105 [Tumidithrix helvetica PCC 7403]|uniref:GUN4 domain-containing protein n=1 Tax=Tumidithrix helvetica TaxID=3457545 RepID=UPI003C91F428